MQASDETAQQQSRQPLRAQVAPIRIRNTPAPADSPLSDAVRTNNAFHSTYKKTSC
jgi:hypothetical protein